METAERDSTEDWLIPEESGPPLLSELERRIDDAVAIAKSSERAAIAVGGAALDAAQQARRAAEIAERAATAALSATEATPTASPADHRARGHLEDAALRRFSERADRVAARLRAMSHA